MTWKIKHRLTGDVLASGDGEIKDANLSEAYLGGANLGGANLRWANLSEAYLREANLSGANLGGANLRWANLSGANLSGANLSGANLREANLRWANLSGAYLGGANLGGANLVIDLGQRSDGYQFYLYCRDDGEPIVIAGCRYLRMSEARAHWQDTRGGTWLGDETMAILDHGERLLAIRRANRATQ